MRAGFRRVICAIKPAFHARRIDPSNRAPGPGRGRSRSGFRPTGVMEGATGLPVGIHRLAPCACKGFSTGNLFSLAQA